MNEFSGHPTWSKRHRYGQTVSFRMDKLHQYGNTRMAYKSETTSVALRGTCFLGPLETPMLAVVLLSCEASHCCACLLATWGPGPLHHAHDENAVSRSAVSVLIDRWFRSGFTDVRSSDAHLTPLFV
uniref:Uncharacterized protein n=1 Tax=Physcomitrium patens TaxID=3218 RepID=A0A2K1INU7_PHYPA|nr:hypothetical protein PHYPA_027244 [Physcomitrium patens]